MSHCLVDTKTGGGSSQPHPGTRTGCCGCFLPDLTGFTTCRHQGDRPSPPYLAYLDRQQCSTARSAIARAAGTSQPPSPYPLPRGERELKTSNTNIIFQKKNRLPLVDTKRNIRSALLIPPPLVGGARGRGWRRGRDSNPRYAFDVHTLSRRAPQTAGTPLGIARPAKK